MWYCIPTALFLITVPVMLGVIKRKMIYAPVPPGLDPYAAASREFWDTRRDRRRMTKKTLAILACAWIVATAGVWVGTNIQVSFAKPQEAAQSVDQEKEKTNGETQENITYGPEHFAGYRHGCAAAARGVRVCSGSDGHNIRNIPGDLLTGQQQAARLVADDPCSIGGIIQ